MRGGISVARRRGVKLMANSKQPVIKVKELASICIIVRDLDKSMQSMWDNFGIGPWDVFIRAFNSTRETDSISDMTYYGRPAQFSYKVAIKQNKPGGLGIELIQPIEGDNIYSDFLREHGEGIQHVGWYIVDSLEKLGETTRRLEKAGFPCIQSARTYSTADAYFDTTKVLNTILQVYWRDYSKFQSRRPSRVFPE